MMALNHEVSKLERVYSKERKQQLVALFKNKYRLQVSQQAVFFSSADKLE